MGGEGFEPPMYLTSRFYRPLASPICIPTHIKMLELVIGIEPTTYWLLVSCSTYWATPAYGGAGGVRTHTPVTRPNGFQDHPLNQLEYCSIFGASSQTWTDNLLLTRQLLYLLSYGSIYWWHQRELNPSFQDWKSCVLTIRRWCHVWCLGRVSNPHPLDFQSNAQTS